MIKVIVLVIVLSFLITNFIQIIVNWYSKKLRLLTVFTNYLWFKIVTIICMIAAFFLISNPLDRYLFYLLLIPLFAILIIDKLTFMIPDLLNYSIALIGLGLIIYKAINHTLSWFNVILLIIFIGFLCLANILYHHLKGYEFIGYGDIKLLLFVGLFSSGLCVSFTLLLGSLLAIMVEIIIKKKRQKIFPFGPYLVIGFIISYLLLTYLSYI